MAMTDMEDSLWIVRKGIELFERKLSWCILRYSSLETQESREMGV